MADMFWGSYFGFCTDKYGVQWMIDCATTTTTTTTTSSISTKYGKGELQKTAKALRDAPSVASESAEPFKKMKPEDEDEPHAKKAKVEKEYDAT
jgi:hypothetical protein